MTPAPMPPLHRARLVAPEAAVAAAAELLDDGIGVIEAEPLDDGSGAWSVTLATPRRPTPEWLESVAQCLGVAFGLSGVSVERSVKAACAPRLDPGAFVWAPVRVAGWELAVGPGDGRRWGRRRIRLADPFAFGVGDHPTTGICLGLVGKLARPGMRVHDLGSGTGVLAIAAARTGARVTASDRDPNAVAAMRRNLDANHLPRVPALLADGFRHPALAGRTWPLVLANLIPEPLVRLAPAIRAALAPGGRAVLSGLRAGQRQRVLTACRRARLRLVVEVRRAGWAALVVARRGEGRR